MIVDKCELCDFYVVVGTAADHRRILQAHERSEHGRVEPDRQDRHPDT